MTVDRHTLALVGIIGNSLDLLGALYLAYDLLGGEHGPLRTLSRAVTYGALFGTGFGLAGGPVFGLITGVAHGVTLAWEFSRASRNLPKPGLWLDSTMSAIRGAGFGVGAAWTLGWRFGLMFGALSTLGQVIAYQIGIRPTAEYKPGLRPRLTRFQVLTAVNRTVGYGLAGYVSSLIAHQPDSALTMGLRSGLTIGIVTGVFSSCTPLVEWTADHIPAKRMGVFGVGLILIGFALQSVQYWLTLLDVTVQ
jgi:hypothetical protein